MKVNKIDESKFEHEAAGLSAPAVGSLFVCLFCTTIVSYCFLIKWCRLRCSFLTSRTTKHTR